MGRERVFLNLLLVLALLAPLGAAPLQAPKPYRILIVAPSENHSGAGHSIVSTAPVFREDLTLPNGLKAIGPTATPASTVDIAIRNIVSPLPDLVVTGINRGHNLGLSIYVSGTNGGAREAAFRGIPAIATSIDTAVSPQELGPAAAEVLGVARRVKQHGLPKYGFLNVNVPRRPGGGYKGYMVTTAASVKGGTESFAEVKRPATNQTVYWDVFSPDNAPAPQGTDIWAVANGYVSVTPLKVDETDPSQMDALRSWFK